eukprot:9206108-Pyramimonas_sp.AAC.2
MVHVAVLLNLAACALKEKRFEDAIEYSRDAIHVSKKDVKALYRLGQVCSLAGNASCGASVTKCYLLRSDS